MDLAALRREYELKGLQESDLDPDPVVQFHRWFQDAVHADVIEPNAMTLATVDENGHPDARIVLLKAADAAGFTFFTNYTSAKGQQLAAHPHAALVFAWLQIERQVRIHGPVGKVSREETEAYFQSRPRGAQLGAWASPQSTVIAGREALERNLSDVTARFGQGPIPAPPHWGGYRLVPTHYEFWQGRPNRLHDRLRYRRENGAWRIERLSA